MKIEDLVEVALGSMKTGPKSLDKVLRFAAETNDVDIPDPFELLRKKLATRDPNDDAVTHLKMAVWKWDHSEEPSWTRDTSPNTKERRQLICSLLGLDDKDALLLNEAIPPFTRAQRATVVAEDHESWYWTRSNRSSFYWGAYARQLSRPGSGWSSEAIAALSNSTDDIVSRLSDPTRTDIYPVKGLVMGYVQSGKTAHFTGVIAKAIDSGYRLVIVLAGTLNLLRRQTQRRLDRELVGRELLSSGDDYAGAVDWESFVSHGGRPSDLGRFDIERLTDLQGDYRRLGARLGALKMNKVNPNHPFNDPVNLARAPVRLIVLKKLPQVISRLAIDLEALRKQGEHLDEMPTLVIDDESDQASINTIKPSDSGKNQRTKTNGAIVDLLKALPRAQYVGYTATPFANVFVDPEDAEQLFPKDFIVSLPRPYGYMGVADFFDLDGNPDERGPNESHYVRDVKGDDQRPDNLPKAMDSFVLAGALKLYRASKDPVNYRYRHHTMLVHHASATAVHEEQRQSVELMFRAGRFTSPAGIKRLALLYKSDFEKYLNGADPSPKSFDELLPFIGECWSKITSDKAVRIVNGDEKNRDDTPDFDSAPVWAILIGGTKLSRGYTVEGLTTSYYRRKATAGDTLMQMGRWFGFRPGYADLVRWFVGREEPAGKGGKAVDLYEQFGALCRDEEAFRRELTRYVDNKEILPRQVPPLVHSHLPTLKPTSKNKMYNAIITFQNMGGEWKEKVVISTKEASDNRKLAAAFLDRIDFRSASLAGTLKGRGAKFEAFVGLVEKDEVLAFLNGFKWAAGAHPVQLEIEYIKGKHGDPEISQWLVMLPQLYGTKETCDIGKLKDVTVVERSRSTASYGALSDPTHRSVAAYIAGVDRDSFENPSSDLKALAQRGVAVLVIYLVRERGIQGAPVEVGFTLQFPNSKLKKEISWGVIDPKAKAAVVIDRKS